MADLPRALDAALRARYRVSEVRTPATQRRGLIARMNQLEKHHTMKGDRPGQAAARAARAAGISPRTWNRWRAGTQAPSAPLLGKLTDAHRSAITLPALRRSLRSAGLPTEVKVSAVIRWNGYYNQGQPRGKPQGWRTVRFGPSGIPRAMRDTIRDWALGGPDQAALTFEYGISAANNVPGESDYPEPGDEGPGIRFEGDDTDIQFL